ncbi:RAMP superfamily CRISPR-associated protein [Psychromonas arctica]|uniref:RAMP superfamily CRISPR-associated protein n=1 Tax=Psychromonas arctica TaxID=168275 RepID=UPI002FCE9A11
MRLFYTLKTIEPIIMSENHSTENNDSCLDYIPGSAILGALAAQHYTVLNEQKSWDVFHSGETIFSHCYPVVNDQLALPTPASWHFAKGDEVLDDSGKYNAESISNHASPTFKREQAVQYKQCRDGYINSDAQSAIVNQGITTKTAIDNQTGGAKESQLFSYAYIQPGQTFLGWIECPDDVAEQFKTSLSKGLSLGRSRNSEFGKVAINLVEAPLIAPPNNNNETLVLWCLSDCECYDQDGNPTFMPKLKDLHPQLIGKLNKQKSFIRSTSCSRFNQKRAGLDSEQMLIAKGSVLVYDLKEVDQTHLNTLSETGIGINKQQGLGWVNVNPDWAFNASLANDNALFNRIAIKQHESKKVNITTTTPLLTWLSEKLTEDIEATSRKQQVSRLLETIVQAYKNARRYNNILNSNEAGPSSTQWRRISTVIREKEKDWAKAVFKGDHTICKASKDQLGWGINWSEANKLTDFAATMNNELSHLDSKTMRELLEKVNRYDLSTFKGLNKMCIELGLKPLSKDGAGHHE